MAKSFTWRLSVLAKKIERLHKEDLDAFVAYNLSNCDLVMAIF